MSRRPRCCATTHRAPRHDHSSISFAHIVRSESQAPYPTTTRSRSPGLGCVRGKLGLESQPRGAARGRPAGVQVLRHVAQMQVLTLAGGRCWRTHADRHAAFQDEFPRPCRGQHNKPSPGSEPEVLSFGDEAPELHNNRTFGSESGVLGNAARRTNLFVCPSPGPSAHARPKFLQRWRSCQTFATPFGILP